MGCDSCALGLQAEAKKKQEEGEELTEDERELLEQDAEEIDPPFAYGPLSSWDGAYCKFCFRVGIILSVLLGVGAGFGAMYSSTISAPPSAVGSIVAIVLGLIVGYLGRFPILGPVFGPPIERIFATFGIYLTAKAEQEYEEADEEPDPTPEETYSVEQEAAMMQPEEDDTPAVSEDEYKQLAEKKRREAKRIRQDKKDIERQKSELEDEKEQLEEDKKELQEQVQDFRNTLQVAGSFGQKRDQDTVAADAAPVYVKHAEDAVPVGPFWMVDIIRYDHEYFGEIPIPFGVWDVSDIGQIPSEPVEVVEDQDLPELGEFMMLNPNELEHPIDFVSPDHKKFDPDNDVPLFTATVGTRDDVQSRLLDPTIEPETHTEKMEQEATHAILTLGIDTAGQPVPLAHDVRGFEHRQELRSEKRKKERKWREIRNQKNRREEQLQDMRHDLETLQDKNQRLEKRLQKAQENEKKALEGRQALDQSARTLERGYQHLETELDHQKQEKQAVDQKRRQHRKEKLEETNSVEQDRQQASVQQEEISRDAERIEKIRRVWDHPEIDPDRLSDGDYSHTYDEYVRDFVQADVNGNAEKVQKSIVGELTGAT